MSSVKDEAVKFVGRESERKTLTELLEKAKEGQGQNVFIIGDAGIGKSTMVEYLELEASRLGMSILKGECTEQEIGDPYNAFKKALTGISDEELFSLEEFVYFNELFLISKVGLLISNVSSSTEKGMDEDILSSMLTAVQDFVKDSFGGGADETIQKGGLGKLEYKDTKILIEHGDHVYLAAVTSGEEHPSMRKDLRKTLAEIEETYFDILADWDGDLDNVSGTVSILEEIGGRKYRVKRSMDNIDLEAERLKVQAKIHNLMEEVSDKNGLLFVIDDIHWADESTVMAMPYLARNIMDDEILFCMTYRPEDIDKESSRIKEIIEATKLESRCVEIFLDSLDESSLEALVKNLLDGGQAPDELLEKLKTETGGNPFFIIEVIRALMAEGTLVEEDGVWIMRRSPEDTIPSSVVELVSRRLETLGLDCLRIVEASAVLGRRFERSVLTSSFSMNEERMTLLINQIIDLNILEEQSETDLRFQHAKIQEVIYSGMSDRWKRMLHRNAGETLERAHKKDTDPVLYKLAYHFGRTLEFEKGIDYSVSAGYKAMYNVAPREAAQFFETAINMIDESKIEDERYLEVMEQLGDLHELEGDYVNALGRYEAILGQSAEKYKQSEITMKMGKVFQNQGNYDDAIETYENAIKIAEIIDSSLLKARINGYMGKIHLRKGEYDKALELQTDYLKESKITGDKREIGQAFMNLGGVYLHLNDNQKAVDSWEESLKWFKEVGYDQGIAYVNDNLGVGHLWLGNFEKALQYYEKSSEIMRKLGNTKGMSMVLNNIGVLYQRMGNNDKSLEYYRKSLQIKKKIGDTVGVATLYNNIGVIYFEIGHIDKAIQIYKQNLEIMESSGDTWGTAQALNSIAEAELELNMLDEAKKHCMRAIEIGEESSLKEILSSNYRLMGVITSTEDEMETADQYFEKSLSLARETEDPQRIGLAHFSLAQSLFKRGEKEKAMTDFASALEIFEKAKMEALAKKTRLEMQKLIDSE